MQSSVVNWFVLDKRKVKLLNHVLLQVYDDLLELVQSKIYKRVSKHVINS